MGGPSRESYLAHLERQRAKLDALRTREGVVDLAEWKALEPKVRAWAERFLAGEPWFLGVRLAPAPDVGFVIVVRASFPPPSSWLHSTLEAFPFRFEVVNPGAGPS